MEPVRISTVQREPSHYTRIHYATLGIYDRAVPKEQLCQCTGQSWESCKQLTKSFRPIKDSRETEIMVETTGGG